MKTYFSDFFNVTEESLNRHGAFNVSLVTDLPLFIDPFLLFNSKKRQYQQLHEEMIQYLSFLRDKARGGPVDSSLLQAWYLFPEVKQTWLGFTRTGNSGSGLGADFAAALSENLHRLFRDFGEEEITKGSHLEKLCLIRRGVGRDNISDFTTNLIKRYLCEYTQAFARKHVDANYRREVAVPKARFNYDTETWETERFELPWARGDYVLLTPKDMLTKDDTWINKEDLIREFPDIPDAIPNTALRAQINNYFKKVLVRRKGRAATQKEKAEATRRTILEFPQLIDFFIRYKEEHGNDAESISSAKVRQSEQVYVAQIKKLQDTLEKETDFYRIAPNTYKEAHQRVEFLKDVIENKGGHRIFYVGGKPIQREEDLHVMYRLVWIGSPSDVSREVNDGRGPADFKIARGARDKTIVEFKLAKNKSLEKNLQKQAEIYQRASDAQHAIKVIVFFTDSELWRVNRILKRLKMDGHRDIVLIDASDDKPSASRA